MNADNYIITKSDFNNQKVNKVILSKSANLNEINYFIYLYLYELDDSGRELFDVLINCNKIKLETTRDLLSGLFALNDYYSIRNVNSIERVGSFYLLLASEFHSEVATTDFDKDDCVKVGKAVVASEDGWFYRGTYYGRMKANSISETTEKEIDIPKGFILV